MTPISTRQRPAAIREARAAARLTQQGLAERARCSVAYVQMVEAGYVPGRLEASPAYLRILGVLDGERRPDPADARKNGEVAPHGGE